MDIYFGISGDIISLFSFGLFSIDLLVLQAN